MTSGDGVDDLLQATGVLEVAADAERSSTLVSVLGGGGATDSWEDLALSAEMLELEAHNERDPRRREALLADAFACWIRLAVSDERPPLAEQLLAPELALALHLAATGSAAGRVTETRQALARVLPLANELSPSTDADWLRAIVADTSLAFALLARKDNGWADIGLALSILQSLRERQLQFESGFLDGQVDQRAAAMRLVASYHLAQMATTAGRFIETGKGSMHQVVTRLDTHRSQALVALATVNDGGLARVIDLVHTGLRPLIERSIWAQIETLGAVVGRLASTLAARDNLEPTLELWPSQVEAMNQSLLDPYRRAVVVQMPTSAGKTLLAKFSIVQTLALNPGGRVAYVVPTRVLVNQVTTELRRDLKPLGFTVEQAIPVVDLDPTESLLLSGLPSVLVTTPEKLDLLIRTSHPVADELALVIVDEAHNLGEPKRGARLEILLATLRRDKPAARFLLLSPFIPNAASLAKWLGGERGSSIRVDWKPNKKLIGEFAIRKEVHPLDGRRKQSFLTLKPIAAADNYHVDLGADLELGPASVKDLTLAKIAVAAQGRLEGRGATLLVCNGRPNSAKRAYEIASRRGERQLTPEGNAVLRHVITELGAESDLAYCIQRGVAYHHSGMSLDTRRLVENLLASGDLDVVCGTTTLAQGANFPIANVIVESIRIGDSDITHSQFWNIAGRAGRGMLSGLGVVGYPVTGPAQSDRWAKFFETEASDIASRLAKVVEHADSIGNDFLSALNRSSDIESLSEFLQYLAHAFRVSGAMRSANEIEDLLRSSLVFAETERVSRASAQRLVQLCRSYLTSLQGHNSLVALADGTGFSTPAINLLLGGLKEYPSIRALETWDPSSLFGASLDPLTQRLELISRMPELRLSPEDEVGEFDPRRAAKVLRDWVNGMPIPDMVAKHARPKPSAQATHAAFVTYLLGGLSQNASWGLGALAKVAFAGSEGSNDDDAPYVSTMVYYGVNTREATWMRMAGLPREVARGAAELWRGEDRPAPESFDDIRSWVSSLSASRWKVALADTALLPEDVERLWA